MIESILLWLLKRIYIFSSGKYIPKILIPFAGHLMLKLSHGIVWFRFHRKEYKQVVVQYHRRQSKRQSNILLGRHSWYFLNEKGIPWSWIPAVPLTRPVFSLLKDLTDYIHEGKWQIVEVTD